MKRPRLSEMLLVSAPLALFVAAPLYVFISRTMNPPHNPNDKIALSVAPSKVNLASGNDSQLSFGWIARTSNSPQSRISVKFAERIVAIGKGKSLVVYKSPAATEETFSINSTSTVRNLTQSSNKGTEGGRFIRLSPEIVPAWADRVEWQGEVVAVPSAKGSSSPTLTPTLRKLALTPGATRLIKRFALSFNRSDSKNRSGKVSA